MKKTTILLLTAILLASCVSKKKYLALEQENGEIKSELTKTRVEKEDLEAKFAKIQARVDEYNTKISSLTNEVGVLNLENDAKFSVENDGSVISNNAKESMRETLKNVDPEKVNQAKTLTDAPPSF